MCNEFRYKFNSLSDKIKYDQKKHQNKKFQNVTSFVFSEIMLDEIDV